MYLGQLRNVLRSCQIIVIKYIKNEQNNCFIVYILNLFDMSLMNNVIVLLYKFELKYSSTIKIILELLIFMYFIILYKKIFKNNKKIFKFDYAVK